MKLLFGCHCQGFVRMTRKRSLEIAWYLVRLHDHHQSFHHGGAPPRLSLTLDPTQAYSFHSAHVETKALEDGRRVYNLMGWQEQIFHTMRTTVFHKLSLLNNASPNGSLDDLFTGFRHIGMPWIEACETPGRLCGGVFTSNDARVGSRLGSAVASLHRLALRLSCDPHKPSRLTQFRCPGSKGFKGAA